MLHFHSYCDTCLSDCARFLHESNVSAPGTAYKTRAAAEYDARLFESKDHINLVAECEKNCHISPAIIAAHDFV